MNDTLLYLIDNSLTSIIVIFICAALLKVNIKDIYKRLLICFPFIWIVIYLEETFAPAQFSTLLTESVSFLLVYYCFRKSFSSTIMLYIISYIVGALLGIPALVFMPFETALSEWQFHMIGNGTMLILAILVYCFVPINRFYSRIENGSILIKMVFIDCFITIYAIVAASKLAPNIFLNILPFIILFMVAIVGACADSIRQTKELAEKSKLLSSYQLYLPVVDELIKDVKVKQHDIDNTITSIRMLPITHKDYNSLSNALTNYGQMALIDMQETNLLKLNTKLVAGFLFAKKKEAEDKNLKVLLDVSSIQIESKLEEYDLVQMLGILIDNAIEACKEDDELYIRIENDNHQLRFSIANPGFLSDTERKKLFDRGYSTKKDQVDKKHQGLGLYNLRKTIFANDGTIELNNIKLQEKDYIEFIITI